MIETIGRYQIERVLGRGAMGVIYKAHDPEIDRPVAIKLIHSDLLDGEEREAYLARFRREAQAAGRCIHPNIVALYDYALHDGNPFLVMEFVDGTNLARARQNGARFTPHEATDVMLQVLDALGSAHALGVVHRDIKPANILLMERRRVKVTDFGISRIGNASLTSHGVMVGTPSYMSPEQCRGDEVDLRSDLFSAGVVLFELLTGERPFAGSTVAEVTAKVLYADLPNLQGRVPDGLAGVLNRSLAKNPADRFASAAAMANALRGRESPPDDSATVVSSVQDHARVDDEVLTTLQRRLAEHIGPIAKVLVSSAVQQAPDLDSLYEMLAKNIGLAQDREAFLRDVRRDRGTAAPVMRPGSISSEAIQLAQSGLTRILGPIARVLVRQAAPSCGSATELWDKLSQHIERPADRAAFLKTRPRE